MAGSSSSPEQYCLWGVRRAAHSADHGAIPEGAALRRRAYFLIGADPACRLSAQGNSLASIRPGLITATIAGALGHRAGCIIYSFRFAVCRLREPLGRRRADRQRARVNGDPPPKNPINRCSTSLRARRVGSGIVLMYRPPRSADTPCPKPAKQPMSADSWRGRQQAVAIRGPGESQISWPSPGSAWLARALPSRRIEVGLGPRCRHSKARPSGSSARSSGPGAAASTSHPRDRTPRSQSCSGRRRTGTRSTAHQEPS